MLSQEIPQNPRILNESLLFWTSWKHFTTSGKQNTALLSLGALATFRGSCTFAPIVRLAAVPMTKSFPVPTISQGGKRAPSDARDTARKLKSVYHPELTRLSFPLQNARQALSVKEARFQCRSILTSIHSGGCPDPTKKERHLCLRRTQELVLRVLLFGVTGCLTSFPLLHILLAFESTHGSWASLLREKGKCRNWTLSPHYHQL